jgi:DNA polymerase-4
MILHIDMDAFYASVEQLDNPELKSKCVIVGGLARRGVVSAASYEARKVGVHSAMPIFKAKKICPDGVFIVPRISRYKEISHNIMKILQRFSPLVEPVSIDEAYVDHSGCERLYGSPTQMGKAIKKTIQQEVNLTCSVGGAPYKFLAKIASDLNKPDGMYIIHPEEAISFITSLPIHKIPGVGNKTHQKLDQLGIKTLGQVRNYPDSILSSHLGKFGKRLKELAHGIDHSKVSTLSERSSVSSESTLAEDTSDRELLIAQLLLQSEYIGRQLRKTGAKAKTIVLKIKHADFKQITRSKTIKKNTHTTATIFKESVKLLRAYQDKRKIRLIGVGASGLRSHDAPVQQSLFVKRNDQKAHWDKVDKVMDDITEKFGKNMVKRGAQPFKQPGKKA